jgi:hypothetical protein
MDDTEKDTPVDPYAPTEPDPRDPIRDVALLVRAFLVLRGELPMREPE